MVDAFALHSTTLAQVLRVRKRKDYKRLFKNTAKFLSDLDTEIDAGWTGLGQTNYLLGRLTMREYVFHHVIQAVSRVKVKHWSKQSSRSLRHSLVMPNSAAPTRTRQESCGVGKKH